MTNQQGAPEALRRAKEITELMCSNEAAARRIAAAADELCRLHYENQRLAALVEAQRPAPSAAVEVGRATVNRAAVMDWFDQRGSNWVTYDDLASLFHTHPTPQADSQPASTYSIDADTQGIRARVADAITGALAFGAQGAQPPPTGHWLAPFWEMAREEVIRASRAPADSVTAPAYLIDTDPQGIRARVADAIIGALAFGAQGANPPPAAHWLAPFWEMAREEASRNRPVSSDTLYLLRRLLSNQHTLTGSEFREELTKIVGEATQAADSVLEDAARLLESQHTWLTNVAAANLVRSLAARKQGGAT